MNRCVAVVVRTLGDRPRMLVEALRSISNQDHPDTTAIVAWDGPGLPNFDALDLCSEWVFPRGRWRTRAGNAGIKRALELDDVAYVTFLDDDDVIYPNHVSNLVSVLEGSQAGVAYSDSCIVVGCDSENQHGERWKILDDDFSHDDLCNECKRPNHSFLIRKGLLALEQFDQSLDVSEDWDLWVRLSCRTEFVHAPGVTAEYRHRLDGSNTTRRQKEACERAVAINRARFMKLMRGGVTK